VSSLWVSCVRAVSHKLLRSPVEVNDVSGYFNVSYDGSWIGQAMNRKVLSAPWDAAWAAALHLEFKLAEHAVDNGAWGVARGCTSYRTRPPPPLVRPASALARHAVDIPRNTLVSNLHHLMAHGVVRSDGVVLRPIVMRTISAAPAVGDAAAAAGVGGAGGGGGHVAAAAASAPAAAVLAAGAAGAAAAGAVLAKRPRRAMVPAADEEEGAGEVAGRGRRGARGGPAVRGTGRGRGRGVTRAKRPRASSPDDDE
jgi:hypothetical protein